MTGGMRVLGDLALLTVSDQVKSGPPTVFSASSQQPSCRGPLPLLSYTWRTYSPKPPQKVAQRQPLPSQSALLQFSSVQSLSRVRLCDPMNCSTPGLPVHHQLLEFAQTHVHQIGDAIQPSHSLSSPSPPAPNPSQHQGLFQ